MAVSRKLILVLAAALLVVTATVAYAAIPSSGGVISGCRHNSTGALRAIDAEAGATCAGNETPLNWPSTDKTGVTGLEQVTAVGSGQIAFGDGVQVQALCPSTKFAISGGFHLLGSSFYLQRSSWVNIAVNPQQGWIVEAVNLSQGTQNASDVRAFAICVDR